jgi:hypothetical protein
MKVAVYSRLQNRLPPKDKDKFSTHGHCPIGADTMPACPSNVLS